jgi:hypothetical protein
MHAQCYIRRRIDSWGVPCAIDAGEDLDSIVHRDAADYHSADYS